MGKIVLYCQPGAKQTRVVGLHDGKIKLQLKAPPVDGAANKALIIFISELCGVSKSGITIELGESARTKRVKVDGLTDSELLSVFQVQGLDKDADVLGA
jgi:uncharacterized protein (TIGR00251 family)